MKRAIAFVWIAICLFSVSACKQPEESMVRGDITEQMVGKTYVYEKDRAGLEFAIRINEDGTFSYYEGVFSSYMAYGEWTVERDILTLEDRVYPFVNRFKVMGSDLVFLSEDSTNFLYVKVSDGEKFSETEKDVLVPIIHFSDDVS